MSPADLDPADFHPAADPHPLIIVMGVTASGKSTVGALVAAELTVPFIDADDLHPESNVEKMRVGTPLTDDDRWPWLELVGDALANAASTGLVVACSALKRAYREAILARAPHTSFVLLDVSRATLTERLSKRAGHFMPASLLDSQLATLERLEADEPGIIVGVEATPAQIAAAITRH